jgi:hypothetical protein
MKRTTQPSMTGLAARMDARVEPGHDEFKVKS